MDDDVHWANLLKRLDHWYSMRAINYTPDIATRVVASLEAVLDKDDEVTAEQFTDHINAHFSYAGAQLGARSFYSSLMGATDTLLAALDTEAAEEKYGVRVYNVSIQPFIEAMGKIRTFTAVADLLQKQGSLSDVRIDVAFSATFYGLDGFLLYDRELSSAKQELFRVTLGENHPELRMLRKYNAPLQEARDTYHKAVFGTIPTLDVKIPVHTLV